MNKAIQESTMAVLPVCQGGTQKPHSCVLVNHFPQTGLLSAGHTC